MQCVPCCSDFFGDFLQAVELNCETKKQAKGQSCIAAMWLRMGKYFHLITDIIILCYTYTDQA